MMAAFNVTALSDLGYDEKTSFIDPMEAQYRSKAFSQNDLDNRSGDFSDSAISDKCSFFNGKVAYKNVLGVETALEKYWSTKGSNTATTLLTITKSSGGSGKSAATGSSATGSKTEDSSTPAAAAKATSGSASASSSASASA